MSSAAEKFCLRWNDFESNVSSSLKDIREEKDFFDVTLACDDSQVEAHKVIIAACSPFFRSVLKKNPHQHPLLYLKGVRYKELICVLNFMYQGEVNVAQEELNSFLAVAEDLQVKGLTQGSSSNSDNKTKSEHKSSIPRNVRDQDFPPPKRPRPAPAPSYQQQQQPAPSAAGAADDDDIQEVVPVKAEPGSAMAGTTAAAAYGVGEQSGAVALEEDYSEENYDYGGYGEAAGYDDGSGMIDPNTGMPIAGADGNKEYLDASIRNKMVRTADGFYTCTDCDYSTRYLTTCQNHIESKHVSTAGIQCQFCTTVCPTRHALTMHMGRRHKKNI